MNGKLILPLAATSIVLFSQSSPSRQNAPAPAPNIHPSATSASTSLPFRAQDEGLPSFKPTNGLSGSLSMLGPDSMEGVVQAWITAFKKHQPGCNITYLGGLTDAAAENLIVGGSIMAGMLREMTMAEYNSFKDKWHYAPTRVWVAVNPLAVYVNSNNPILSFTLDQLDAIYSTTRKAGAKTSIDTWGDLGLLRDWTVRNITPYSRDEGTATRKFFHQRVMLNGAFKSKVVAVADHSALLEAPIIDAGGIAVSSLDTPAPGTKLVPLTHSGGQRPCLPTTDSVLKGDYPLARFFYFYVNKAPNTPMPPLVTSFLSFILSKEGQQIAHNGHQIPISPEIARAGLARIQ